MASNLTLVLNEDALLDDLIRLEGPGFDKAEREGFESYNDYGNLFVWVNRETGDIILIEVERFRAFAEDAVIEIRNNPLPWTFSVASLGIKEKPLEDVILAAWKRFKNVKIEWER